MVALSLVCADPDADVLELVAAGRRDDALRLLMQRHGRTVYRFCSVALRDEVWADDVHQLVFIQSHRDLPAFAGRARLRTWLFTIARHRVLDAVRAEHRRRRRVAHAADDEPAEAPLADDRLDAARLQHALVACLAELPEDVRLAVLLRYQQGLSFEEIAAIGGDKAGTVQARVARALVKLRGRLAGDPRAPARAS